MLDGSEPTADFKPEQLSMLPPLSLRELIIQQSMLCSEQQALFVDALFEGPNIRPMEAYMRAGYKCNTDAGMISASARLKRAKHVSRLIALRREQNRRASCVNSDFLIGHHLYLMEKSQAAAEYLASSKIAVEVAKLCGIQKKQDKKEEDLEALGNADAVNASDLSDAEWDAIIAANAKASDKKEADEEAASDDD